MQEEAEAAPPPSPMLAALRAARKGEGRVSPNPLVGAALLQPEGRIRTAHHARFGGPHAEAELLSPGKRLPKGSILYLTLEPCVHRGKTPPCVEQVVASRPDRVVVATLDPDRRVSGRGIARLAKEGIPVEVGPGEREALEGNLAFHLRHRLGRSLVRLKLATSLDGRLATAGGRSRWITGPSARRAVHAERALADALVVGSGTVLADDPRLTVRDVPGPEPTKVVLDSRLRIDPRCRLQKAWVDLEGRSGEGTASALGSAARALGNHVRVENGPRLWFMRRSRLVLATREGRSEKRLRPFREAGWEIWEFPESEGGGLPLRALARRLAREGFLRALVEAGPSLAGSLLRADLVDELSLYLAPRVLGGPHDWAGGFAADLPGRTFEEVKSRRLGEDRHLLLRRTGLLERVALRVSRGASG